MYTPESVVAGTAFVLFSVLGVATQLWKIWQRVAEQRATGIRIPGYATKGLVPLREFMAFLFFYLFFCSGLTRTAVDGMLVGTRLPAVIIQFGIVFVMFVDRKTRLAACFFFSSALLLAFSVYLSADRYFAVDPHSVVYGWWIDKSLVVLLLPFLWGRLRHAYTVWNLTERSVSSAFREIGNILKDLTGSWYAFMGSGELLFILIVHIASMASSLAILAAIAKNRGSTEEKDIK